MKRFAQFAVVVASVALCGCGSRQDHPADDPSSAILDPSKVHPVTQDMKTAAAQASQKTAPAFEAKDDDGQPISLASLSGGKPVLLYFIEKDCPCCVTAEPFIERFAAAYKDKVQVAGVINSTVPDAHGWRLKNRFPCPVISDPKSEIIKKYEIVTATYSVLINQQGKIELLTPGYSTELIRKLDSAAAKLCGLPDSGRVDTTGAPAKPTSGCAF